MTTEQPTHRLDITAELCPMTFVRTRLLLDRMRAGEVAEIVLREGEPLNNVPAAVRNLGHVVMAVDPTGRPGVYRMLVRVSAAAGAG
jgi:TusA-related sulfurtransferase